MSGDDAGLSDARRRILEARIRGRSDQGRVARPVTRRAQPGPTPLSIEQEQLWYFSQLAPGNPVYNELVTIRRDGPLNVDALRAAFNQLVGRHEIWRSTFEVVDGEPVQVVHPAPTYELPVLDLGSMPRASAEREAVRLAAEDSSRPYALDRDPLLRPLLVRFAENHHRLYLGLHHLIFDGVTLYRVILPELVAMYDAFSAGRPSPLADRPIQYADFAVWERELADGSAFGGRLGHWQRRLAGAATLQLPLDHPRPAQQRFRGGMEPVSISAELAERLRALSRDAGATFFQTVASAFAALLHRYTGQDDVVFATIADQRQRSELELMVGYCLTPLVLRTDASGDPTFLELLARLRGELLDGLANQAPFERILRGLKVQRSTGLNPIFQAMIVLEPPTIVADPSWSLQQMEVAIGNAVGHAKLDLHIELDEQPDGHVTGRLIYNTDLFDPSTAHRMAGHWNRLLEGIATDPLQRISALPLLTEDEHIQLAEWNHTAADFPRDACVHDLVSAQARRTPDAVAVVAGDEQLTFSELESRANAVAQRLRVARAARGEIVALYVQRSLNMIVGLLGILKTGAAYLPLDPGDPAGRTALLLEDSGAAVLLTQRSLRATLPDTAARVVVIDGRGLEGTALPAAQRTSPDDLAYLIYTSGSTGKPKGVQVRHAGVVNLLTSMANEPGIGPSDTVLALTKCSFDMSVPELFLPLVTGARLVIAQPDVVRDVRELSRLISDSRATFMQATPSTWQMLRDVGWGGSRTLVALSGAETLPASLAGWIAERTAGLWNAYGPTETTVWSTLARIEPGAGVTVGRPIANTMVYILDNRGRPVPVGVAGEIFIAGAGVTGGYLNRPELNQRRFVPDPAAPSTRMYATGDLGRFLADGRIEHLGRLDHQMKLRGHRVEPGEIEAVLLTEGDLTAAVVVARQQSSGDTRLVAYVVPAGSAPRSAELRRRLGATLPEHMVPSAFVVMDSLPLTANGKIDRTALPAPQWNERESAAGYEQPRTELEERVARIWARTLGIESVGIHDDFFTLGGHSLLAVRLLVELERDLNVEVPLASFIESGVTVAGLAAVVENSNSAATADRLVVPVRRHGTTPILFFVHADESSLLTLRHFTGPFGPDQSVIGLLPQRIGRRFDRTRGIEDLALPMLATVREKQPHGPYFLAGFSLGGLLAYELAGRLRAAGEEVAWLGVIDAYTPAAGALRVEHQISLSQRVAEQWERGIWTAVRRTNGYLRNHLNRGLVSAGLRSSKMSDEFDWRGARALANRYACSGNDATMDLFVSDERAAAAADDSLGWDELHKGLLRVHRVHGDHLSIVTEPDVLALADLVRGCLHQAGGTRELMVS